MKVILRHISTPVDYNYEHVGTFPSSMLLNLHLSSRFKFILLDVRITVGKRGQWVNSPRKYVLFLMGSLDSRNFYDAMLRSHVFFIQLD